MSARDAILASLSPDTASDPDAIAREAAALLVGLERPPMKDGDVEALFVAKLSLASIAATHDHVATVADLPSSVARYLAEHAAPPALYLPPDPRLDAADWSAFDRLPQVLVDDGAALAWALAGVAETGSLVLEQRQTLMSF